MIKEVTDYLERLGISESEAKLYLTLLQTGAISVRELARTSGIPRTTAYTSLALLIEKGLVVKVVNGSHTLFAASQPKEVLPYLVRQKVQASKEIEDRLAHTLTLLDQTLPREHTKVVSEAEIKYYKGKLGVRKIYEEALQAKELRSYANLSIMEGVFPENLSLFTDAFKNNPELKIYEIVEDSPQSRKQAAYSSQNERYFYKFLPKETKLSAADTLIYDGNVSVINVGSKITGIVIRNVDHYSNSKELFDLHWKDLPDIVR